MRLNCYTCNDRPLKLYKLDFGLPALRCETCEGTYIDLLTYRMWLEDNAGRLNDKNVNNQDFDVTELENTETGISCQRCNKYMDKYRINSELENTINVCHTCDDVWLDRDEWQLLKHLNVLDKLTDVMSDDWQNTLKHEEAILNFKNRYRALLDVDFERVEEFANWLEHHEHREEIRHYLSRHRPW